MNRNEQTQELDRILLDRDGIAPSSGFAASVMDAIVREATAPAPLPFPWKAALPGLAAVLAGFLILCRLVSATLQGMHHDEGGNWLQWLQSNSQAATAFRTEVVPVLLALAVSYACIVLCRKFAVGWSAR